jgi:putative hydrolase of the HAD superfamily
VQRWVVFDAKGVLYRHGEDVDELLIPYARDHGSLAPAGLIRASYLKASLGEISSADLWRSIGVLGDDSDERYCARHELTDGVHEFLAVDHGVRLACLSNDVSEWSAILRRRFGIEDALETWLISGEVGLRKPDPRIYEMLARRLGIDGDAILFVDDRAPNLDAAAGRGWSTVQFGGGCSAHRSVHEFAELLAIVACWSQAR